MTTEVYIKHNGPASHTVVVEVVSETSGNVIQGHVLKQPGDDIRLYVYKQQSLRVTEGELE